MNKIIFGMMLMTSFSVFSNDMQSNDKSEFERGFDAGKSSCVSTRPTRCFCRPAGVLEMPVGNGETYSIAKYLTVEDCLKAVRTRPDCN